MVWIEPQSVELLGSLLTGVRSISVNTVAGDVLEEHDESGPYAVFVDATDVSIEVVIEREIHDDGVMIGKLATPGSLGSLRFTAAPSNTSAHSESYAASVVITSVKHIVQGTSGFIQRVVCRAVSDDGASHPLTLNGEGEA